MKDVYDKDYFSKKKKINSKGKGNAFERKVCKILNERFNTNEFCRSPGSGAFATTHTLPEHLQVYGDIIAPIGWKFVIECKKGYSGENINSLFNKKSLFWGFIKQCERDAKKANKLPMVIMQQDRGKILALVGNTNQIDINGVILFNDWVLLTLEDLLALDGWYFF